MGGILNDGYQLRDGCKERIDWSDGGITGPLGDGKDTGCICIGVDATVEQEYKVPAGSIAESEISQSSFTVACLLQRAFHLGMVLQPT